MSLEERDSEIKFYQSAPTAPGWGGREREREREGERERERERERL